MSRDFDAARGLSPDAARVWREALAPHLGEAARVLDLGSGTGRFAVLIARWFGSAVVGVEPATSMLDVARASARHPNVRYVGGRAERLPFAAGSFDVALLSNVYHHIVERRVCASELHRVLRRGGRVLIRGAFAGRLGGYTLFEYFPEAKVVCEQFPSLDDARRDFAASGFELDEIRRVVQQTCLGLEEFASRTRLRADTTLALMGDDAFRRRQAELEAAAAREREPTPVVDTIDLLVFRKVTG